MPRKGRHSGAVLRYQNGSESFHNHTAMDIRVGTGDKGQQFLLSGTGFSGIQTLVPLACASSEMHPSSGDKGEKSNEQQQDPGMSPAVKSLKYLKEGRKLFFSFGSPS